MDSLIFVKVKNKTFETFVYVFGKTLFENLLVIFSVSIIESLLELV